MFNAFFWYPSKTNGEDKQRLIDLMIQYPYIRYIKLQIAADHKVSICTMQLIFNKSMIRISKSIEKIF